MDPLTSNRMKQGDGIQLGLYALALHAINGGQIQLSICKPGETLVPQLMLEEVLALDDLWKALARMQSTGIFGMRGELRSEFGRAVCLPFATLSISGEVLESKWRITHSFLDEAED
jgi:hypothetical protein